MSGKLAYEDLLDPATKRAQWNPAQKNVIRWAMGLLGQIRSAKKTKAVRNNARKSWTADARASRAANRRLRVRQAMKEAVTRATAKGAK